MNITIPAWAIYAGGIVVGVAYVLHLIHSKIIPEIVQLYQDVATLKAAHVSNANQINNLLASNRATTAQVVSLAKSIAPETGSQPFDLNKTTVLNQPVINQPVIKEEPEETTPLDSQVKELQD